MTLNLQLGDIIKIIAPTDTELHEKMFFIDYIDATRVSVVEEERAHILTIDETGGFSNKSIESIELLSRDDNSGYARQNGLLPDTWVTIKLSEDIPVFVTGKITNLEEDMIEVLVWPEKKPIYIDFGYKGILFFQDKQNYLDVQIRDEPEVYKQTEEQTEEIKEDDIEKDFLVKEKLNEILLDADSIEFGEELGSIKQIVDVPTSELRFGIKAQTDDMLDDFLAEIPTMERSKRVIDRVHMMIERYIQLRKHFSVMDSQDNPVKPLVKGAQHKPLVHYLNTFDKDLMWIKPIVKHYVKLYDVMDDSDDVHVNSIVDSLTRENLIKEEVRAIPDGTNIYKKIYNDINNFYTPFDDAEPGETMKQVRVKGNVEALVSNFDILKSSVVHDEDVKEYYMNTTRYNKGLEWLEVVDRQGRTIITEKKEMVPSDKLGIVGVAMMDNYNEAFLNLHTATILAKSLLHNRDVYGINRKNTSEQVLTMEDLTTEIEYDNLTQKNNVFLLDDKILSQDNIYDVFLERIVPKIREAFHLMKDNTTHPYSLYNVVKQMEPFLIYHEDITFTQYKEIYEFVKTGITEYKKKYATDKKAYKQYATINIDSFGRYQLPLKLEDEKSLQSLYNILPYDLPSTVLSKTLVDNNAGLVSYLKIANHEMYTNISVDDSIKERAAEIERTKAEPTEPNCKKFVIAKSYDNIDILNSDNEKQIYFDRAYDPTQYDMLELYPQRELSREDYINVIAENLKTNVGLSIEEATFDATSMVDQRRAVRENDIAILRKPDGPAYYKRVGDQWMLDAEIMSVLSNKEVCDVQDKCIYINNSCQNMETVEKSNEEQELKIVIDRINADIGKDAEAIKTQFTQEAADAKTKLEAIAEFQIKQLKDRIKLDIAAQLAEDDIPPVSPYSGILNAILGDTDFVRKLSNITRFASNFLVENEKNPFMYVCKDTGVPLLPTFLVKMSKAYFQGTYEQVVEDICKEQGVINDEGDKWVDKHSGFTIKMLEFDTDEGFDTSGYKAVSREILEKDASLSREQDGKEYDDPLSQKIFNIISSVTGFIGVDISNMHGFIIKNVSISIKDIVPSKETYAKRVQDAKEKGKKIPSHDFIYSNFLLIITLVLIAVVIQCQIPSVRVKKTFPNCSKSFSGFPLVHSEADLSGLRYIACVANKIKSKTKTWYTLMRVKEDGILKKMVTVCKKLLEKPDVQHIIKQKRVYMKTADDDIAEEVEFERWLTFLPPLTMFKEERVMKLSPDYFADIEKGKLADIDKINAVYFKNFYLSLAIQKTIQIVLDKEELLLKTNNNVYFLENACCNTDEPHTLKYFMKRERSIEEHIEMSRKYSEKFYDYMRYNKCAMLNHTESTKLVYPEVSDEFSENTVYLAFIHNCKFNTGIVLSEALQGVCQNNQAGFSVFQPLNEKIAVMKDQGLNYTQADLTTLMHIVNNQNSLGVVIADDIPGAKERFQIVVDHFVESRKLNTDFLALISKIYEIYGTGYSEHKKEVDDLKDFLVPERRRLLESLRSFLEMNGREHRDLKKLSDFFEAIENMKAINASMNISEDNTTLKTTVFIKNIIMTFVESAISIIRNNRDFSGVAVPRHWNLSQRHNADVQKFVNNTYKHLNKFYRNEELIDFLDSINMDVIKRLVEGIPFDLSASTDDDGLSLFNYDIIQHIYLYLLMVVFNEFVIKDGTPTLKQSLTELIMTFVDMLTETLNQTDVNKNSIYDKVLFSREKEKDEITLYLKDLSIEEREVENVFKNNKLGKWSKGITKGVVEYVGDVYDTELADIEKKALLEMKAEKDGISNENRTIYMYELEQELRENAELEREINDLSGLGDDDDFGENDGDEHF